MADDCTNLVLERVRARIEMAGFHYVTTGLDNTAAGDILSFSLNKSRGQSTASLSCQLAVWINNSAALESFNYVEDNMGHRIILKAGALVGEPQDEFAGLPTLFTGYVVNVREQPHWSDARKYILDVQAEDVFAKMKYMGKFSRRFKIKDEAFATINGGKRRQGGNMTNLYRIPPGRKGLSFIHAGSTGGNEHSSLIKTPDYKPKSPEGIKKSTGSARTSEAAASLRAEPSKTYAKKGDAVFIQIIDRSTGEAVDVAAKAQAAGAGCVMCCDPPPQALQTGSSSGGSGIKFGENTFPVKCVTGSSQDPTAKGFEVTITGDYPARLTYIDPQTGETATVEFDIVPPHTHRDMTGGGPAVSVYDAYGV